MKTHIKRKSNLELLRIICMFMIIAHHYVVHGDISYSIADNQFAVLYLKCISMFGKTACSIFALISGYFMIESNATIKNIIKKIIPILFQMLFCSLVVLLIVYIFGGEIGFKDIVKCVCPFIFGNNWYVQTYICFILFVPFINIFFKNLAKRDYLILLLIISISYFLINTIPSSALTFGNFQFMFNMYAFGAYYKLYGKNIKYSLLYSFGCFAIMIASEVAIAILGNFLNSDTIIGKYGPLSSYSNIFSFGLAFFLFAYFANKEYHSNLVNKISSTTLGIYMLHDNQLIYQMIWLKWFPNANFVNNPYFHSISKIILVFIIGMTIDFIRQITIKKIFDKHIYPKINEFVDNKTLIIDKLMKID